MHPLDLVKTKLQTSNTPGKGNVFNHIGLSLREIYIKDGVKGLYRGVGPNVAGNASSWGLYFLLSVFPSLLRSSFDFFFFLVDSYNMLRKRGSEEGELSSGKTLLYAAEASRYYSLRSDSSEVDSRVIRCRYRDTHQPNMGSESQDVHNTSGRPYSVPGPMACVSFAHPIPTSNSPGDPHVYMNTENIPGV